MSDAVDVADLARLFVVVSCDGDERRYDTGDAQLLCQLTRCGVAVRLADADDPAGREVPPSGEHVLVVGPAVHEEPAVGRHDDDRHRAMSQVVGPHAGAGDDLDHPVELVDALDVLDTLTAGLWRHNSCRTMRT